MPPRVTSDVFGFRLGEGEEGIGAVRLRAAGRSYLTARRPDFAPGTRRQQSYILAGFVRTVGPELDTSRLTRGHVERWLASLELSPSTIRARLSVVRVFTEWLVVSGYVKRDPCAGVKGPRAPVAMPREIDDANALGRLLKATPDERGELIVLLMLQEGLRRAEVAGLARERLDLDGRLMLVRGKGNVERWLPISAETFGALERYVALVPGATGPLVRSETHPGRGISPNQVGKLVARWMVAAGVKHRAYDGRSAHALRHTFAGAMLDDGADIRDVQQALGHRSLGPTFVYLRRRQATGRLREVMGRRTYGGRDV